MSESDRQNDTKSTPPPPSDERPYKPADDSEEVYFEGSPVLRAELFQTFLWGLAGVVCIALVVAGWVQGWGWPILLDIGLIVLGLVLLVIPYITTKTVRYRVSNYRIDFERGIFSKRIDTLELWHVDDINFNQSLLDRIFGVGTITVFSNDDTNPKLPLHGIPNPRPVFEALKQRIIAVKRQRGVVKMDLG